jgi:hypothetical protein
VATGILPVEKVATGILPVEKVATGILPVEKVATGILPVETGWQFSLAIHHQLARLTHSAGKMPAATVRHARGHC